MDPTHELVCLRRASRALAGMDRDVLTSLPPDAMRKVCLARGWHLTGTRDFPGEPGQVAMEKYENSEAMGTPHRHGIRNCVMVPVVTKTGDYAYRVVDWAHAMSSRHGDVSPAEILAEALLVGCSPEVT